ncbi:hypothetical protein DEO72_LG11g1244 [Vigna unguiculata]|uniref:Uncharacterized protein n=1 Tax=Vigna unguiculata TaxID=3917 RepID=A0A4D6NPT7_VIGUN|nr:hypothetical protein DEO72_LG11g1244 [Vigna unguiculata]
MRPSHHAPYALGDTRATMGGTKGRDLARESLVIAGQPYGGESVPGPCTHRPSHYRSWPCLKSLPLTVRRGMPKARLATGVKSPPFGRPARRAISSVVERAPDNCVVVPGLRIDGAIQLSLEHMFRFGLNGKNGAPNNVSSQTKNYEIAPFILGRVSECLPFSSHQSYFTNTCHGKEEGGTSTLGERSAMIYFTGEVSGSSPGWPSCVEEKNRKKTNLTPSCMLHSARGDIAQLVELRSCNWVVAITVQHRLPRFQQAKRSSSSQIHEELVTICHIPFPTGCQQHFLTLPAIEYVHDMPQPKSPSSSQFNIASLVSNRPKGCLLRRSTKSSSRFAIFHFPRVVNNTFSHYPQSSTCMTCQSTSYLPSIALKTTGCERTILFTTSSRTTLRRSTKSSSRLATFHFPRVVNNTFSHFSKSGTCMTCQSMSYFPSTALKTTGCGRTILFTISSRTTSQSRDTTELTKLNPSSHNAPHPKELALTRASLRYFIRWNTCVTLGSFNTSSWWKDRIRSSHKVPFSG